MPWTNSQLLDHYLNGNPNAADIKYIVRLLRIDLQQEPEYSRTILNSLLSRVDDSGSAFDQVIHFLNDPFLNTLGAKNFSAAVNHLARWGADAARCGALFDTICRALELGLVPGDEIHRIVTKLHGAGLEEAGKEQRHTDILISFYRRMWDAIGRCTIFSHTDLDSHLVHTWLEVLSAVVPNCVDAVCLGRDIILATRCSAPDLNLWTAPFITKWLDLFRQDLLKHGSIVGDDANFVHVILDRLDPDAASACLIRVTEILTSSAEYLPNRKVLLSIWQMCIRRLPNIKSMALSRVWTEVWECSGARVGSASVETRLSIPHRVVLRLWMIIEFCHAERHAQAGLSRAIISYLLYNLARIGSMTDRGADLFIANFLLSMSKELNLPGNGLLPTVVGQSQPSSKRPVTDLTFGVMALIEADKVTPQDVLRSKLFFDATRSRLYSFFEKMVRAIDITSPSFVEEQLQVSQKGTMQDNWVFFRLIQLHSPLKISLSRAWKPAPRASDMTLVRYRPPGTPAFPDPHAALELVHSVALGIAANNNISDRAAFRLVHLLYRYLVTYYAPIRPTLVRALYHTGITRPWRSKGHTSKAKYTYVLNILRKYETPEVVEAFMDPYKTRRRRTR